MTASAQTASSQSTNASARFGTFGGVFTPNVLTILGLILFLPGGLGCGPGRNGGRAADRGDRQLDQLSDRSVAVSDSDIDECARRRQVLSDIADAWA